MSYFEDQEDAWMELGCPGDISDIDSDDMINAHFVREKRERQERNAKHGFPSITQWEKAEQQAYKNVYGMSKQEWIKKGNPAPLAGKGLKAELKKLRKIANTEKT